MEQHFFFRSGLLRAFVVLIELCIPLKNVNTYKKMTNQCNARALSTYVAA